MKWSQKEYDDYISKYNSSVAKYHPGCDEIADEGKESTLQLKCEQWLKMKGFHYLHDRSRKKNPAGMFLDLHIYLPAGRHVVVELKVKGNKMSKEQVDTYRKLMFLGHEVYECRSYKRFLEIMNNTGLTN